MAWDFVVFMGLWFGCICFIVWVSSKNDENHREKVLDVFKETAKIYREPKPLWKQTTQTTRRVRKIRRKQAEGKE